MGAKLHGDNPPEEDNAFRISDGLLDPVSSDLVRNSKRDEPDRERSRLLRTARQIAR